MSGVLRISITADPSGLLKSTEQAQKAMAALTAHASAMSGGMLADFAKVNGALSGMKGKFAGFGVDLAEMLGGQLKVLAERGIRIELRPNLTDLVASAVAQLPAQPMAMKLPGKAGPGGSASQEPPKSGAPADSSGRPVACDFGSVMPDPGRVVSEAVMAAMEGPLAPILRQSLGMGSQSAGKLPHNSGPVSPGEQAHAEKQPAGYFNAHQFPSFPDSSLEKFKLAMGNSGGQSENGNHLARAMADTNKSLAALTMLVAQQTAILKQIANGLRQGHQNLE